MKKQNKSVSTLPLGIVAQNIVSILNIGMTSLNLNYAEFSVSVSKDGCGYSAEVTGVNEDRAAKILQEFMLENYEFYQFGAVSFNTENEDKFCEILANLLNWDKATNGTRFEFEDC